MFISIIIPTLNEEAYVGKLLKFLSAHPMRDQYEVIVVDGGSSDETVRIVADFTVQLYLTATNSRAHQMNRGARYAKGNVLYFVHADVELIPSFVVDIERELSRGKRSGCFRYSFNKPKNPLLCVNGFFTRFPFRWCRGGDQTLFITRETFEMLEGFNEDYVIMEDYELLDRMEKEGVSFKVIQKSIKVSSRKYDSNPYWKVQLVNLKAMRMYRRGVAPKKIKAFYSEALN